MPAVLKPPTLLVYHKSAILTGSILLRQQETCAEMMTFAKPYLHWTYSLRYILKHGVSLRQKELWGDCGRRNRYEGDGKIPYLPRASHDLLHTPFSHTWEYNSNDAQKSSKTSKPEGMGHAQKSCLRMKCIMQWSSGRLNPKYDVCYFYSLMWKTQGTPCISPLSKVMTDDVKTLRWNKLKSYQQQFFGIWCFLFVFLLLLLF